MNIYLTRPPRVETTKQLSGWITEFHLDVRELTAQERQEYDIPDTYIDEQGVEHPQEAYTDVYAFYRHENPLTEEDYGAMVSAIVRARYSADDVEAIMQNYIANKTAEHRTEWQNLQDWRDEAKSYAHLAIS